MRCEFVLAATTRRCHGGGYLTAAAGPAGRRIITLITPNWWGAAIPETQGYVSGAPRSTESSAPQSASAQSKKRMDRLRRAESPPATPCLQKNRSAVSSCDPLNQTRVAEESRRRHPICHPVRLLRGGSSGPVDLIPNSSDLGRSAACRAAKAARAVFFWGSSLEFRRTKNLFWRSSSTAAQCQPR